MADASDSKSDVGDYVWVQVPSPALKSAKRIKVSFALFACINIFKNQKKIASRRCNHSALERKNICVVTVHSSASLLRNLLH